MKYRKIVIVTPSLYSKRNNAIKIGGLETYIYNLAKILIDGGYNCEIIQFDEKETVYNIEYDGLKIQNLPIGHNRYNIEFNNLVKSNPSDYYIIATDQMDIKYHGDNALQIQHGIAFDLPREYITGIWGKSKLLQRINKILRVIKNGERHKNIRNEVCVDYNYYNWLRTISSIEVKEYVKVIPNFASEIASEQFVDDKLLARGNPIKILFARRFVEYRGTLMFANVAKRLLSQYSNITITFAGEGPLENTIKELLSSTPNIEFTKYNSAESLDFHKKYDIAVVPTIYSEGTSLSICEAMAAGCFCVATHVGGITNLIIDKYNGLLCLPEEDDLLLKIENTLSLTNDEFNRIAKNGWACTKTTFCKENWGAEWLEFIRKLTK